MLDHILTTCSRVLRYNVEHVTRYGLLVLLRIGIQRIFNHTREPLDMRLGVCVRETCVKAAWHGYVINTCCFVHSKVIFDFYVIYFEVVCTTVHDYQFYLRV